MNLYARFALTTGACSLLIACGTPPPIAAPETVLQAAAAATSSFRVLHSFDGSDGWLPDATLIDVKGTFYGTTWSGGTYGKGTVFSVTTTGKERVIHSFAGGNDGGEPAATLLELNGTLYGTTYYGGTYDEGTVFAVDAKGEETVLHSFGSGSDGESPEGGLIDVKGVIYGTPADNRTGEPSLLSRRLAARRTALSIALMVSTVEYRRRT